MRLETYQTPCDALWGAPSRSGHLFEGGKRVWIRSLIVALIIIGSISIESGHASLLSKNLSAAVNLSGVQSTSKGITQTSLRQEMSGNWFRSLTPYLSVSATASYFKTDFDRSHEITLFKEEFSPSARISMNHPYLRFNANLSKTKATGSLLSEELTRNSFSADLQTKMLNMPVIRSEYSQGTTRDSRSHRGKNLRDNSFGIGITHNLGDWTGRYKLTRTGTQNLVTDFESTSYRHMVRAEWNREVFYKRPIRLSGDGLFSYRTHTDRVPQDSVLLHTISPASGLYAEHQDATFGRLEPVNDLTDNDITSPTTPAINIGTGSTNQHIGVNLTIERSVSGLYIYTDRLSDESVTWEIYVSDDRLTWSPHNISPDAFFDAGLNRYEIVFPEVRTRYIKAISGGVNRVENVSVTEIVALAEVDNQGEVTQSAKSYRMNFGAKVQLNEKWKASSDVSFHHTPSVGLAGRRDNLSNTIRANYLATEVLTHSFGFQASLNSASGEQDDYSDYSLSYNIRYKPLPTLLLTGSSSGRLGRINGETESESFNIQGKLTADPIDDLTFDLNLGYGWDNRHSAARRSDSWNTKVGLNARPFRTLNFRLSYGRRSFDVKDAPDITPQQELSFAMTLRPVSKIHINGQISRTSGRHEYTRQLVSASWNFTRKLSLSGQYRYSDDSKGNKTLRRMASFSWRVGARADIYMGYNKSELSGEGAGAESISAGVRMRI